jgi:hypothetical protein
LISTINKIKALHLEPDTIWYRKSNLFTLIIELYKLESEIDVNRYKEKLIQFENNILANKNADRDENDFSKYYSYMYTGTNSRQARVTRGELFYKYIISE